MLQHKEFDVTSMRIQFFARFSMVIQHHSKMISEILVGGFNPFEKYARQNRDLPHFFGVKIPKKYLRNHHRLVIHICIYMKSPQTGYNHTL